MHTEADRRGVQRRADEIADESHFNPRSFLELASRMDPPYGDRAAYWQAIADYIAKLEKKLGVRSPRSRKLK